jgi:hypothetical protein
MFASSLSGPHDSIIHTYPHMHLHTSPYIICIWYIHHIFLSIYPYLSIYLSVCGSRAWTQGLMLARQVLYFWATLLVLWLFFQLGSPAFCQGWPQTAILLHLLMAGIDYKSEPPHIVVFFILKILHFLFLAIGLEHQLYISSKYPLFFIHGFMHDTFPPDSIQETFGV